MTDDLKEQKKAARILLGLKDEQHMPIKMADRSPEALLVTIDLLNKSASDHTAARLATEEMLHKRLKAERKARALANARADKAVAAMRAMLVAFDMQKETKA